MVSFRRPGEGCCANNVGPGTSAQIAPPKSRRWADLDDGSEECEEDGTSPPQLVVDDSYREAPVACLEDSKGDLNRRLARSANFEEQPQDFTFLLKTAGGVAMDNESSAEELRAKDVAPPQTTWQPNVNAPEFIPTWSVQCPLVGFVSGVHTPSRCGTQSTLEPNSTPEKGREPSPAGSGRRRGGGGKRRRASAAQGPAQKRTKSEDREGDHKVSFAAPTPMAPMSMPSQEATEEDWQRRAEMRQKAIDIVKKFPEYRWYSEAKRDENSPSTPNPLDRAISKRRWKYLTAQWRLALKQRYLEDGHGSVAHTEDAESAQLDGDELE